MNANRCGRLARETGVGIDRSYAYSVTGELLSVTDAVQGVNVSYTYDAIGRMTSESINGLKTSYGLDLAGNAVRTVYPVTLDRGLR